MVREDARAFAYCAPHLWRVRKMPCVETKHARNILAAACASHHGDPTGCVSGAHGETMREADGHTLHFCEYDEAAQQCLVLDPTLPHVLCAEAPGGVQCTQAASYKGQLLCHELAAPASQS
jgi:hypothetical protein